MRELTRHPLSAVDNQKSAGSLTRPAAIRLARLSSGRATSFSGRTRPATRRPSAQHGLSIGRDFGAASERYTCAGASGDGRDARVSERTSRDSVGSSPTCPFSRQSELHPFAHAPQILSGLRSFERMNCAGSRARPFSRRGLDARRRSARLRSRKMGIFLDAHFPSSKRYSPHTSP